jgi:predicted Zn-dependent protease
LQQAQDRQAKAILDQRNAIGTIGAEERITTHTAFAAIPVRYAIERGAWKDAASLEPMRTPFREAEAIVWFGRVIGAARSGDVAAAARDLAQLSRLHTELSTPSGDPYWAEQVGIQHAAASAWVALGESRVVDAVAAMRKAADWEERTEKHVAMENRLWPMRQLLGELLLEAGRPADALREFERSLRTSPNRFRSFAGAARAAAELRNRKLASSYYRKLLALTANAEGDRPELNAARQFLASR